MSYIGEEAFIGTISGKLCAAVKWLLREFSTGWLPKDYVTAAIALAALILSLRRELNERPRLRFGMASVRNTWVEPAYLGITDIVLRVTNTGKQPLSIVGGEAEYWDIASRRFDMSNSYDVLVGGVVKNQTTLTLNQGETHDLKFDVSQCKKGFLITAMGVLDSTHKRWKASGGQLALINRESCEKLPKIDLSTYRMKWISREWLQLRIAIFLLLQRLHGVR